MASLREVIHYALAGSRVKPPKISSRFLGALAALGLSTIFLLMAIHDKCQGLPWIKQKIPGVWHKMIKGLLGRSLVQNLGFFLFIRDMLPLPQPALVFSLDEHSHAQQEGQQQLLQQESGSRTKETVHWAKLVDIKYVYQQAAGTLICWKGSLWSAFFPQFRKGHGSLTWSFRGSCSALLHKASFNPVHAVFLDHVPVTSPAALLPCSSKTLAWKSKNFSIEQRNNLKAHNCSNGGIVRLYIASPRLWLFSLLALKKAAESRGVKW